MLKSFDKQKILLPNRYWEILHEIALDLMDQFELPHLLEKILGSACELVHTSQGYFYLVSDNHAYIEVKVTRGLSQGIMGKRLKKGQELSGKVWESGTILVLDDYSQATARNPDTTYDVVHAWIGIPLKHQQEVLGVFCLEYVEPHRYFLPEEIAILEQFAEFAALALHNTRLYTRLETEVLDLRVAEARLQYIGSHDTLTGMYNRSYFEACMRCFRSTEYAYAGLVICDIDGLKMVNDTIGHLAGDKVLIAVADILLDAFSGVDCVARIGGDEFAILLPHTTDGEIKQYCKKIHSRLAGYNRATPDIPLSLSIGYMISRDKAADMQELFKEADNNMYHEKIHQSRSTRSAITHSLMKMLIKSEVVDERNYGLLMELADQMAAKLNLTKQQRDNLHRLCQFHDIGIAGLSDRILFKAAPLTASEKEKMKRHCEIGYRIAQLSPELLVIADWILKHHEWWNGTGYPLGIAGEEIPLACRIMAICESYATMADKNALSAETALLKLQEKSGLQFDPHLVEQFSQIIQATTLWDDAGKTLF